MDGILIRNKMTGIKPTVIIVENSIDVTGAFKAIFNYAKFVSTEFDFVFVVPAKSSNVENVESAGFAVVELPFVEIGKSPKKLLLYVPYLIYNSIRLLQIVKQTRPYLVHVNDFYNLVGVVGKLLGGKYQLLTHVRFMPDRFPLSLVKIWYGLGVRYSISIICVSHAVKKHLPEHPKVKVIYDTIPAIINPPKDEKPEKSDGLIHLLYLGHYISGKGQDHALEAFNLAYQENEHIRLRYVGSDMGMDKNKKFKEKLMARAIDLGIDEVVEFQGPSDDIEKEYAWADITLNFSESESFSFTCLEALAHGVPLIATDCGGPTELFEHGVSGWLVPRCSVRVMSEAILQLAESPNLRKQFSNESIKYVRNNFNEQNTFQNIKQLYYSICIL